jgi:uncharacterized protein (UPF0548 family)
MIVLREPTDVQLRAYLARQSEQDFSYDCIRCTRDGPVARQGWKFDSHRVLLGHGREVFQRGSQAIDAWQMFPSEMTRVVGCDKPRERLDVVVVYRSAIFLMRLIMPARIVYTIDDAADDSACAVGRYGFAYGTLPDHPERGEERFTIEWDRSTDAVYYSLVAVSQPAHWIARAGYPYARLEQSRFRRLSGLAMQAAVATTSFRP